MMRGTEGEPHHYGQIEPCWIVAVEPELPSHDPIPCFKYPFRAISVPSFRRVFWSIKIPQPMRFGLDNLDVPIGLRIESVSFCGYAYSKQLATFFTALPT